MRRLQGPAGSATWSSGSGEHLCLQKLRNRLSDQLHTERFGYEDRPRVAYQPHLAFGRRMAADHDYRTPRINTFGRRYNLESAHAGHIAVGDDQVKGVRLQEVDSLPAIDGHDHTTAFVSENMS